MSFTEPAFLLLALPFGLLAFHASARLGRNAALACLFGLSMLAYSSWGGRDLLLLAASVAVNFLVARSLVSIGDERAQARKLVLRLGLAYNFAALFWFKYAIPSLLGRAGATWLDAAHVVLPVGISFYTIQQAVFLVDAYHRDPSVAAHVGGGGSARASLAGFIRHGAFSTFFPLLVIGPITYLREFQRQTASNRFGRFRQQDLAVGLALLGIGLFKKVAIADKLGSNADHVFSLASQRLAMAPAQAWIGVLAYLAQLYFDFSGYSDMALGIGRLFGIRLPINFYSPLKAVGIIDYYRRWHMTLTRVVSRFVFTPMSLAGSRHALAKGMSGGAKRALALWLPLLVNFEVIALWHGAASTFLVFGAIHGLWYVIETEVRGTRSWKAWRTRTPDWLRTLLGRSIVFVPLCLTFALFRCDSLGSARYLYGRLFSVDSGVTHHILTHVRESKVMAGDDSHIGLKLVLAFAIIHGMPNSIEWLRRWRPGLFTYENPSYGGVFRFRWRPDYRWSAFWLLLVGVALLSEAQQSGFIYMGF